MRIVFGILALFCVARAAAAPDPAQIDFFEAKIRPILVESCYECHSAATKSKGGLLLDTKDSVLKGGDSGPALIPGDAEKSLLIKAVRYTDKELQMPPQKKKLKDEQIAALEEWVKMGAPDPRTGATGTAVASAISATAKKHWAFQPVKKPAIPAVKNERWVKTPVDAFILEKLEAKGLKPSERADKRALLRRATFALTGLPPTPEEMRAFNEDQSSDAWEKVVDRLLASPAYGERWARHWLDISRYADTKGYVFQEERRYPFAYTYRDYVIRAFNVDLPYDRFILEQLAADLLNLGEDKRPLAAMGFLTLGRRFLNQEPDIIDDRMDVTMRGLQGLTTTCARCHDHKYDPIPTKDYYSIYGVFASSFEPAEKPLLGAASLPGAYPEYKAEFDKRENERATFVRQKEDEALETLRKKAGEYLLAAHDAKKLDDSKAESLAKERKLEHRVVKRWIESLDEWKKKEGHPIFAPWFAFADLKEDDFATKGAELAAKFAKDEKLNPLVAKAFEGKAPKAMKDVSEAYATALAEVNSQTKSDDAKKEELRQVLFADGAPANLPRGEIPRLWDVPTAEKSRALKRKVDELEATHPGAPPRAMALQDRDTPRNAKVFIRGNARNPGPEVPRQYLEIIAGSDRKPFAKGSGRLEMAQAIASKENPLTARVFVNRVWLQHFGSALVATPSDFGLRSEPPTHPELLDYLAARFMDESWSMKKLHRLLLTSAVYQQASDIRDDGAKADPANQLYWRMNRKRLEFEPMRDTLLAVAGTIDPKIGGHPQDLTTQPFAKRRTVYGFIDRQNLPGMFRTFDLASPDTTSPQRFNTTVPQQALFMINGPFVIEQARKLLERPDVAAAATPEKKIERMYLIALQRKPEADELKLARRFVEGQNEVPTQFDPRPAWSYGYGPLDEAGKLASFTALPAFAENRWAGGSKLPDEKLDWVSLTETGGHPGEKNAAVLRWTAPRDGEISIKGRLGHDADAGDGVRGLILKNGSEQLGAWKAKKSREATEVKNVRIKRGDTIDFVVEKLGDLNSDSFTWSPQIEMASAESDGPVTREWNAREEFCGPRDFPKPLNAWEKLAQVILMSNELVFVD